MTITLDLDATQVIIRVLVLLVPLALAVAHARVGRGNDATLLLAGGTAAVAAASNLLALGGQGFGSDLARTAATGLFAASVVQLLALDAERAGRRAALDQVLQRTPQSTRSIRCPWWLTIMGELAAATTLGLLAGTTTGVVVAALAVLLAAQQATTRRRGPATC